MHRGTLCFIILVWRSAITMVEGIEPKSAVNIKLSMLSSPAHVEHTHQTVLDPDGVFYLYWLPDLTTQEVIFELHVRTLGWFGFGFSSNGNMKGADIMTAWVSDGQLHLQDRHAVDQSMPLIDDHSDWRPIHARENDTHTIVVVARKINTCDPQDFLLTNETTRIIYAWDEQDPVDLSLNYHGQNRGNKLALMLLPFHLAKVPEDVKTWKVLQKQQIPHDQDTFYWCHIERVPPTPTRHHYIGYNMIYGQNSHNYLHHSVAFECIARDGSPTKGIFEKYVGHPGYECYTANMPPDFYLCERFLINWAIGSEGEILPDHVGYPLGEEHGGTDFILFQTHYDNKAFHRDITVEWGMDIYYTDKLREQEAGNIGLGHSIVFSLAVPPKTPHWLVAGHCASECTSQFLPEEGVNVFMVMLHGHYLARSIRLRHFRGGKEMKTIIQDEYFDANFQQTRMLSQEVKILPGDHFTVECVYESLDRGNGTYSGWRALDEMCQAFINYYPRTNMVLCRSAVHPNILKEVYGDYGIESFPENLDMNDFVFDPEVGNGRRFQEVLNSLPWETIDKKILNEKLLNGDQVTKCQYNYGHSLVLNKTITGYPKAAPYIAPEVEVCLLQKSPGQDHSYQTEQGTNRGGLLASSVTGLLFCTVVSQLFW